MNSYYIRFKKPIRDSFAHPLDLHVVATGGALDWQLWKQGAFEESRLLKPVMILWHSPLGYYPDSRKNKAYLN